jgi:hypothetical protein
LPKVKNASESAAGKASASSPMSSKP